MSDNVISFSGAPIDSERREAFVQAVAASFDQYLTEYGYEPDAIVYVMCGLKQPSRISWDIRGDSERGATSILAVAALHCTAEAAARRLGIEP